MNKSKINFTSGSLEVFIATTPEQIRASQELRYRVFCEEMGAKASPEMQAQKRDFDEYDDICDHLLVMDNDKKQIVGSYRLLRRSALPKGRKFYSESEYNLSKMLNYFKGEVMELGRSCVDKEYRNRSTMQLLWRGLGEYSTLYKVEVMFGCASFPGSDHKKHAMHLAYLYYSHLAPEEFRPRALENLYVPMNEIAVEQVDVRPTLTTLPPLIKGYIRLGGFIGDGAFEDKSYNTTDVCIILKTALITQKYQDRYVGKSTEE